MGIADAILPRTRSLVLRELVSRKVGVHIRELARRIDKDPMGVRKELERLESAGIVVKSTRGRRSEYRLNPDCPVYHELRMLIIKTVGAVGLLRDALAPLIKNIRVAFVYGSFATGEMRAESDVDLMVVGDVSFGDVVEAITAVEEQLAVEVNPTVYSPQEFFEKLASGHHFLNSVMEGAKLFIVGGEEDIEGLVRSA